MKAQIFSSAKKKLFERLQENETKLRFGVGSFVILV
jgi:hypothetical protein